MLLLLLLILFLLLLLIRAKLERISIGYVGFNHADRVALDKSFLLGFLSLDFGQIKLSSHLFDYLSEKFILRLDGLLGFEYLIGFVVRDRKMTIKLFDAFLEEFVFLLHLFVEYFDLFNLFSYFLQILLIFQSKLLVSTYIGPVGFDRPP